MFNSLHPDFNSTRLVTFLAALWLQLTVLIILCCVSSPGTSKRMNRMDTLHNEALNLTQKGDA